MSESRVVATLSIRDEDMAFVVDSECPDCRRPVLLLRAREQGRDVERLLDALGWRSGHWTRLRRVVEESHVCRSETDPAAAALAAGDFAAAARHGLRLPREVEREVVQGTRVLEAWLTKLAAGVTPSMQLTRAEFGARLDIEASGMEPLIIQIRGNPIHAYLAQCLLVARFLKHVHVLGQSPK
jgi:hypothetical protein